MALVILVALGIALWTELGDDPGTLSRTEVPSARDRRDADTPEALAAPRAAAAASSSSYHSSGADPT